MKFLFLVLFLYLPTLSFKAQKEIDIQSKLDNSTQKYGLVDSSNSWLVPPQYDLLQKLNTYFYYGEALNKGNYRYRYDESLHQLIKINYLLFDSKLYNNKFVIIQQYVDGSKGIMDINGNEILPAFYSNIWIKENYFIGELDRIQMFLYNQKGEKVFPESFNYIDVKNGYIYVKEKDSRFPNKKKITIYSPDIKLITKDSWNTEGQFGKDHLVLMKNLDNQSFYITTNGQVQIKSNPNLNYESPFSNGFAIVSSKERPKKFGFINTLGKLIIPLIYDEVGPFQERYAYFSKIENGIFIEGLLDSNNKIIKIFPAKVISKSTYYDSNEITYYLSNLETYDADGNFKEDKNIIQ